MNELGNESKAGRPPDDDAIGKLIRSAGRRPAIPTEDLEGFKESARATWKEMVTTERRSRFRRRGLYALAASVLWGLVMVWWWVQGPSTVVPDEIATVALSSGRIQAVGAKSGEGFEIGVGDRLSGGVVLTTAGNEIESPGQISLIMARGQSVRLDAGTRVRFLSDSRLELERGAVYVDSGPAVPDDTSLEIDTPLGLVTEIGTQYEVRLEDGADAVRVRVREGSVTVSRDGESYGAGRGDQLTLRSDGTVARTTVEPDGPEWRWVLASAPALDIEGRSLESFVDWAGRETGWRIRYADEALEESARTIVLHGTIEGLTPDESFGMILHGSGLDHRTENGTIVVIRR